MFYDAKVIDSIVVFVAVVEMWNTYSSVILFRNFQIDSSIMSFITFMIITWDYYFFFNVPGHRSFLFHFFTFALFQINLRVIFIIIYHLIHRIEYYFYQKRTMAAYFGCFYFPLLPQESVMILQAKDFILVFRYFFSINRIFNKFFFQDVDLILN